MTLKELQSKIYSVGVCLSGQFEVVIEYRNKLYKCRSNNTLAYDTLRYDPDPVPSDSYYTMKQAMQALYDECKSKNNLK